MNALEFHSDDSEPFNKNVMKSIDPQSIASM